MPDIQAFLIANRKKIMNHEDISNLHTNQRLIAETLLSKGATLRLLDKHDELIEVTYNGKKDFLLDRFSSVVPYHVVKMSSDKHFAKKILRENGISTPEGEVFTNNTLYYALQYAKDKYPVVLKPNWGSHGDHVQVNIKNEHELQHAISFFVKNTSIKEPFIIEKYYPWREYRLFITAKEGFAVVHREWASITGNGSFTIEQLILEENEKRKILKANTATSICPIVIDNEVILYLQEQNINNGLNHIPLLGEKLFLRKESNLAKGGRAIDMTDTVHPSVKKLAYECLQSFPNLPVAGLDLLCEDVTQPLSKDNYVIIELNSNPGLAMHTYPSEGQSRNVTNLLLEVMFPNFF